MPNTAGNDFRGKTIKRERLLRPFPEFDGVTSTTNDGYSWYHSLQLRIDKRFSRGFTVQANYTFSKFMEATDLLNQDDPRPTRTISDSERPHRLAVSGIYEFPFGKGRRFFSGINPALSKLISGWQLSGIYQYQSGAPLTFGNFIFNGNIQDIVIPGSQRSIGRWFNRQGFVALRAPNGDVVLVQGKPQWVDYNDPCKNKPSCATVLPSPVGFNRDSKFQLVNNVRTFPTRFGFIRGDHINNVDLSILKNTGIGEKKTLQFKFEAVNAFNHPLFPVPNMGPANLEFGSISSSNQANYPRRIQVTAKFLF
jgi:hypothetical protein